MSDRAWMVWAGERTQGFAKKVDAERWAQVVQAFCPRTHVAVQRVVKKP